MSSIATYGTELSRVRSKIVAFIAQIPGIASNHSAIADGLLGASRPEVYIASNISSSVSDRDTLILYANLYKAIVNVIFSMRMENGVSSALERRNAAIAAIVHAGISL